MSYKILGWGGHLVIITIKIRYILKLVQKYYKKLYKITKNMYKLKCNRHSMRYMIFLIHIVLLLV